MPATGDPAASTMKKTAGKDVWHYHLHLFLRYEGDHLYASEQTLSDAEERARYACELKAYPAPLADGRVCPWSGGTIFTK